MFKIVLLVVAIASVAYSKVYKISWKDGDISDPKYRLLVDLTLVKQDLLQKYEPVTVTEVIFQPGLKQSTYYISYKNKDRQDCYAMFSLDHGSEYDLKGIHIDSRGTKCVTNEKKG